MTALDSASLKFWESVGLWGFIFVWVGVAGEGVEIFIKLFNRKLYERKQFCLDVIGAAFWIVLVVALAVEFLGNEKAMRIADSINTQLDIEAGQARKEAGQANERAAKDELAVAVLTSNNLVLQKEVLALNTPRRIMGEQRDKFITLLCNPHNVSKIPIKVIVGESDSETDFFAMQIREMLDITGYGTKPCPFPIITNQSYQGSNFTCSVDNMPFIKGPRPDFLSVYKEIERRPFQFMADASGKNRTEIIAVFVVTNQLRRDEWDNPSISITNLPSGKIGYTYHATKDPNSILFGVVAAFRESGVKVSPTATLTNETVKPGEVAFFIPQKMY